MSIKLNEILKLSEEEYKDWTLCLNQESTGIPESLNSKDQKNNDIIMQCISYKKDPDKRSSFRIIYTKYCLQFIRLGIEGRNEDWLFLGAFEKHDPTIKKAGHEFYNLKKIPRFENFAERLVIRYKKHQGDKQAKLKIEMIESLEVLEILPQIYINRYMPFPGYKNFKIEFRELAEIINNNVGNWRELLSKIQCIYAITDKKEKKIYVGSTYGKNGVWQRWSCYVETNGHGGDKQLKAIIEKDQNYAYENFIFSILEYFYETDKDLIIKREVEWKELLQARDLDLGYNEN